MSRSYHANTTHLRGYSKREIDEMANDPDSILHQLAEKSQTKTEVKKGRKARKFSFPKTQSPQS
jgi:hypothetical protein